MKTTIEIPDAVFRQVKALAASRGISLKRFFTEALQEHIRLSAWSEGLVIVEASFRAADRLVVPSALYESAN